MQLFVFARFTTVDSNQVCMLISGYTNEMYSDTTADLRMGDAPPTANFAGLTATLTETQRKAAINAPISHANTHGS
jgi:hypothetical protein